MTKPGRPRRTRAGQVQSFWLGLDEIKILRAWSAHEGHRSVSETMRSLIRELTSRFTKSEPS